MYIKGLSGMAWRRAGAVSGSRALVKHASQLSKALISQPASQPASQPFGLTTSLRLRSEATTLPPSASTSWATHPTHRRSRRLPPPCWMAPPSGSTSRVSDSQLKAHGNALRRPALLLCGRRPAPCSCSIYLPGLLSSPAQPPPVMPNTATATLSLATSFRKCPPEGYLPCPPSAPSPQRPSRRSRPRRA